MKSLNQYISEKLVLRKKSIKHTLFPKSREELGEMILDEMIKSGNDCDLNHIDISKVSNLDYLFSEREFFRTDKNGKEIDTSMFIGDISQWNTSHVVSMVCTFGRSAFDGDISEWDVSKVEDMQSLFNTSAFDGDISDWDVRNVKDMALMFSSSLFSGDISNWKLDSIKDMGEMFYGCWKFEQNLDKWNIPPSVNMENMFDDSLIECKNLYPKWYTGDRK
jgi:hypothetical protein